LSEFDRFLRGLHSNFGKSTRDASRTIAEIKLLAKTEVPKHGALQPVTRNRHLTFLGQLFAYAKGRGLDVDAALSFTPLRSRKTTRGRDERAVPSEAQLTALFNRPVFHGYAGWDDIDQPGSEFYHRAELSIGVQTGALSASNRALTHYR